ncbi:MAG: hypothetical protein R3A52_25065 [Polyangiales bacterium]
MNKQNKSVPSSMSQEPEVQPRSDASAPELGTLAAIREAPYVPPEDVPEAPRGAAVPLDADQKRTEITWVPDKAQPTLIDALDEIDAHEGEFTGPLCSVAPKVTTAPGLARRIEGLTVTTRKAEKLQVASKGQLEVARSDGHALVKRVAAAIRYAAIDDPGIIDRWPAVMRYENSIAERIAEGKDKAKRAREASKKAEAKKAEAKKENDKPSEG